MDLNHLYLLSTYLKKWSFVDNRISLNYSFCMNDEYVRYSVDMRLQSPLNMVNEFMNNCFHKAKEQLNGNLNDTDQNSGQQANLVMVGDSEIKMKLSEFMNKIMREFNQNKKSQGRQRMISTRSLDFYYNDFEFEPLKDDIKFFVHLNRGANKMNGDLWSHAVEDLKNALNIREKDKMANKYMATALRKMSNYKDGLKHLKIYAEAEKSAESFEDLAIAHLNLMDFKSADKAYAELAKIEPESPTPLFGRAMIAYKQGKSFISFLDKINQINPDWLVEKIKKDWDYKLPALGNSEDYRWNASVAARYLGFERPFDLTKKAFNNDLPSYFDAEKGTIRFVKEELDAWVEIMNRYKIEEVDYKKHEELLTKEELEKANPVKKSGHKKVEKEKKVSTN